MTKNLLSSALLAGVAAGLIAALLQFSFVIPHLMEGELYETGERVHFATDGSTQSDRAQPALGTDFARHGMTVAFNMVTYTGYGLILLALMVLADGKGHKLTPRTGLIWGVAGFIAVQLAPGIGQPPVLPGAIGSEVGPRQAWWAATIIASALALGLIAFGKGWMALLSVPLLLAPHIIGAPYLDTYFGVAPPELSARFAALSFGTALAGWSILGFLCAWFWTRSNEG
ncbi:CbtA family protein [Planktotalea arctica]|uniref:CbtA family protein n=1 Tax=Planktotalea arctica TaxID=1481893 RepID=UPI00321B7726